MNSEPTIQRIRIDALDIELPRAFVGSTYQHHRRYTFVTTVALSDGTTVSSTSGHGHGDPGRVHRWTRTLGDLVIGRSLHDGDRNWQLMHRRAGACGPLEFPYAMGGLAVIDIALWNARGVVMGQPLCHLLGAEREPIPTMLVGGYYSDNGAAADAEALARAAERVGVSAVKLKVGGGERVADDVLKLSAFLDVPIGRPVAVVCDANRGWDVSQATEFVRHGEGHDRLAWVEEPLRGDLERVHARGLRAVSPVAIGSGQSESSVEGACTLVECQAVDVINTDASWCGGITGWLRVRDVAERHGVRVAHHAEPHLAIHLLAGRPQVGFAELYSEERDPVWYQLIDTPPVVDGAITAPDRPGLGLVIDHDFAKRHTTKVSER